MYTKEDLIQNLNAMGIRPTDALMVHSSMKSIGEVEGGADTVVDAFMEYLQEGLFMTPTHTWAQMSETYSTFDPVAEPACVGIIPNIFRCREGVYRSLHPTHSIAAYGSGLKLRKKAEGDVQEPQGEEAKSLGAAVESRGVSSKGYPAEEYVKGEENAVTPCPPGGCWDRLREIDGKILLIGVTHARNTYIHSIDEVFDVPERLTETPTLMQIVMPDGSVRDVRMYRHYNPVSAHISENFDKVSDAFFETGAAKRVKFGDATCILCEARKIFDVYAPMIQREPNCLIERSAIPEEWWK